MSGGLHLHIYNKHPNFLLKTLLELIVPMLLIAPTPVALQKTINILVPMALIIIIYALYLSFKTHMEGLTVASILFIMTSFQSALVQANIIKGTYLFNYGLAIYMIVLAYMISNSYAHLDDLSIQLSSRLLIDPLTKAYNRSYLNSISINTQDTVVL